MTTHSPSEHSHPRPAAGPSAPSSPNIPLPSPTPASSAPVEQEGETSHAPAPLPAVFDLEPESPLPTSATPLPPPGPVVSSDGVRVVSPRHPSAASHPEPFDSTTDSFPPFVEPGLGSPRLMTILGIVLAVAAMASAGMNAPRSTFLAISASALLIAYETILHTGTGIAAIAISARFAQRRFGDAELAVARIFVCVAAFHLVRSLNIPIPWVGVALKWLLAAAVYWGSVVLLFRRSQNESALLACSHGILWSAVQLGAQLSAWVASQWAAGPASTLPAGTGP